MSTQVIIAVPSKTRAAKLTFNRQQRYIIRKQSLIMTKEGTLITYEEYLAEIAAN